MNAYEAAYVPLRPCAVREGAVFSEPRPFFLRPRPFRPALVLPLKARFGEDAIQFKLLSLRIRGWFGSISIISYHFDFPSCPTQYEFKTSKFGNFREARSSAMRCELFRAVSRLTPRCFVRRPPRGRCFLLPPRHVLTRAVMTPCFLSLIHISEPTRLRRIS